MTASSTRTSTPLNIVVDTNQFLSVFLFRGQLVKLVFELVLANRITLAVSPTLRAEVQEKLVFYGASKQTQEDVLAFMDLKGNLIIPTVTVDVCRDKEDNFALELAETAHAHYLVTRDKDLLDLKEWKGTIIIKPEEFLPILRDLKLLK
jgi:uncharacterized protein